MPIYITYIVQYIPVCITEFSGISLPVHFFYSKYIICTVQYVPNKICMEPYYLNIFLLAGHISPLLQTGLCLINFEITPFGIN